MHAARIGKHYSPNLGYMHSLQMSSKKWVTLGQVRISLARGAESPHAEPLTLLSHYFACCRGSGEFQCKELVSPVTSSNVEFSPPKLVLLPVAGSLIAYGVWQIRHAKADAKAANKFYARLPGRLHYEPWVIKVGAYGFILLGVLILVGVCISPASWF